MKNVLLAICVLFCSVFIGCSPKSVSDSARTNDLKIQKIEDLVQIGSLEYRDQVMDFYLQDNAFESAVPSPKIVVTQKDVLFYDNQRKVIKTINLPIIENHIGSHAIITDNGIVAVCLVFKESNKLKQKISFYEPSGKKVWQDVVYDWHTVRIQFSSNGKYFGLTGSSYEAAKNFELFEFGKGKLWEIKMLYSPEFVVFNDGKVVLNDLGIFGPVKKQTYLVFGKYGGVFRKFEDSEDLKNIMHGVFISLHATDNRRFYVEGANYYLFDVEKGMLLKKKRDKNAYHLTSDNQMNTNFSSDGEFYSIYNPSRKVIGVISSEQKERWIFNYKNLIEKYKGHYNGVQFTFLDDEILMLFLQEDNTNKENDFGALMNATVILFDINGNVMLEKELKVEGHNQFIAKLSKDKKGLVFSSNGVGKGDIYTIRIFELLWQVK